MKTSEIIKENNMRMKWEEVSENPNMQDMPNFSKHYKCIIKANKKQGTFYFSKGPALDYGVDLVEVLECLLMDAVFGADYSEYDFINEMGYEDVEEKGKEVYKNIVANYWKLYNIIADDIHDWEGEEE